MFEYGVRNRIAAIEDDVTYSDDCLLVLAVTHLLETERTAFVHRDFVMLVRPGAINGLVENQLLVSINPENVVIHHVILAQACRIEADPVIFTGEVELRIRRDPVSQQCVPCGEKQSFPITFSAHREGVMT